MTRRRHARSDDGAGRHTDPSSGQRRFPDGFVSLLSLAFGVGLTVALIDLLPRLTNLAPDFTCFGYVLLPATLSSILIGVAYLAVLLALTVVFRQHGRRAMDLAFGLAVGLILTQCLLLLLDPKLDPRGAGALKPVAVVACIGAVVGVGGWALLRRMEPTQAARRYLVGLLQLAPLVALAGALLLHVDRFHLRPVTSLRFVVINAGFALALAGILVWYVRRPRQREQSRLGLGMLVLLVLATASGGLRAHALWQAEPGPAASAGGATDRPSVLLVTVETLRADHVSSYRGSVPTPVMDSLARDGVLFERALAPSPWTVPSLASILTGLEPLVHGTTTPKSVLDPQLTTIAERLRDAGYRTAALTDNPFVRLAGLGRGFHQFNPYPKNWGGRVHRSFVRPLLQLPLFPVWCRQQVSARELTDEAIDWIRTHSDERFFLWLHYFDPHQPYSPPPDFSSLPPGAHPRIDLQRIRIGYDVVGPEQRRRLQTLYRDEIRFTDHSLGRLLEALRGLGHYDDTLIVLSSDHGEEFWEHGGLEHGHTLYDELLHVPLIVKPVRSVASGLRPKAPVSIAQIVPTILQLAELDGSELYLPSLAGHWREELPPPGPRPLYASSLSVGEQRTSVTANGYKYILWAHSGIEELYHLPADPREQRDLAFDEPEIVAHHRELLESYRSGALRLGRQLRGEAEAHRFFDPDQSEQLRALGYVE